jgi:hypothetical protein
MLRMFNTAACSTLFGIATMAQVTPIATTRYSYTIPAETDSGDVFIAGRELLVNVDLPKWHSQRGLLFVRFDSSRGYFQWSIAPVPKSQQTVGTSRYDGTYRRFYVAPDRLLFFCVIYTTLDVKESREKATSIDDAEAQSLAEAGRRGAAGLAFKPSDLVTINLGKLLPRNINENFFALPGAANIGVVKLIDVSRKNSTWEVILQGQWQQKITLDDKYKVIGSVRGRKAD